MPQIHARFPAEPRADPRYRSVMPLPRDEDSLYRALLARDAAYDGSCYVGVRTTGVFCRLSCAARKPRRENVAFYDDAPAARAAGFRPCRRCRPEDDGPPRDERLDRLRALVQAEPGRRWTAADLVALGCDPSTVRRAFLRTYGTTFAQYARTLRLGRAVARLREGEPVIEAQLAAGYESGSGFRDAITALVGRPPVQSRTAPMLAACWIETPIGPMLAVVGDDGLQLLEFAERRALPGELARLQRHRTVAFGEHAVANRVRQRLAEYFAGRCEALDDVPVAPAGSAFEAAVWSALRRIPAGETRSYGDLARSLGRPTAARAVARANGANQVALVVPCHRVIGADGALTGYGGKLWRKQWLLEHEYRVSTRPTRLLETAARA
jgi:AraC family transcriptional regulator of adaptative response/methylated-DNA-[protein]-cysteine methyltransferase